MEQCHIAVPYTRVSRGAKKPISKNRPDEYHRSRREVTRNLKIDEPVDETLNSGIRQEFRDGGAGLPDPSRRRRNFGINRSDFAGPTTWPHTRRSSHNDSFPTTSRHPVNRAVIVSKAEVSY